MEPVHEDRYVVFLRHDRGHSNRPDCSERLLTTCGSYEEARRIQRALLQSSRPCVIRFIGPAGGGD
jgi:predicted alpha/beta-fold hydrolase